ncbi:MAG: 4-(cytidine 5'-diphospho)-2-C-methyl-D-erythritol kinase [Lachnospiraceae bacterium]
MERITIQAMAKVNLGLDVLRRREDGYHEVNMVMQTVKLYDTLVLEAKEEEGITVRVDVGDIPTDENNLIARAARILYQHYPITKGVEITLTKRIPIAAGMAGGSTDAAATLVGMNHLFELGLSEERLKELGVRIGADVPYCIQGGTVLSQGIGEKLTALPKAPDCFLVIAKPDLFISTKEVYEKLDAAALTWHPNIDAMVESIKQQDLTEIAANMGNVLETVTEREYPIISQLKQLLKEEGALNALMSGSGPTVFGIFSDEQKARKALEEVRRQKLALQSFVTVLSPDAQVILERT